MDFLFWTLCLLLVLATHGYESLCRPMGCGRQDKYFWKHKKPVQSLIVGGEPASSTDFPHQVFILIPSCKKDGSLGPPDQCGGVIIASDKILTAAHCVFDLPEAYWPLIEVKAGITNIRYSTGVNSQSRRVQTLEIHPQYAISLQDGQIQNDIAMLQLESPLNFNSYVNYIYLPPPGLMFEPTAQVSGWGLTNQQRWDDGKAIHSDILRKVTIDLISNENCQAHFRNYPTSEPGGHKIRDNEIGETERCTLTPGRDACLGDSGGPLTCIVKGTFSDTIYVCGIVSYGFGCAWPGLPGVYVDVASSKIHDWIQNTMGQFGGASINYPPKRTVRTKTRRPEVTVPRVTGHMDIEEKKPMKAEVNVALVKQFDGDKNGANAEATYFSAGATAEYGTEYTGAGVKATMLESKFNYGNVGGVTFGISGDTEFGVGSTKYTSKFLGTGIKADKTGVELSIFGTGFKLGSWASPFKWFS